jgi:sulfite reductase (NADPH) flavoprotein alpha-component
VPVAVAWREVLRRRADRARGGSPVGGTGADATLVVHASQTGFAEELALATARAAGRGRQRGVTSEEPSPTSTVAMLTAAKRALFVVSTTGEGDAPDTAGRVLRRTSGPRRRPAGPDLRPAGAGRPQLQGLLRLRPCGRRLAEAAGAAPLFDVVEVDDADPEAIRHWQHQLNAVTGSNAEPDWTPPSYDRWRLVERRLLNPGSPGGEAFHLAFEPDRATPPTGRPATSSRVGVPSKEDDRPAAPRIFHRLPAFGQAGWSC